MTFTMEIRVQVGRSKKAEAAPQEIDEPEAVALTRRKGWKAVLPLAGTAISEGVRQFLEVHHWRWGAAQASTSRPR